MKCYRWAGVFFLIILFFMPAGHAQKKFQCGVNFSLGFPQNEFRDNIDKIGLGGTVLFVYNLPKSPVSVGASLGFLIYRLDSYDVPFSPALPAFEVNVVTNNFILMSHFLCRLQPQDGNFRPYLDGLIGFNYLSTDTDIRDREFIGYSVIGSYNQSNDIALSYGAGAGIMIPVYKTSDSRKKKPIDVYIDLGLRYLTSAKAEYLKVDYISPKDGRTEYVFVESKTDLLNFNIAVSISF